MTDFIYNGSHIVCHRPMCDPNIKPDTTTNVRSQRESCTWTAIDATPFTHNRNSTHIFSQPHTSPTPDSTYALSHTQFWLPRHTNTGSLKMEPLTQPHRHSHAHTQTQTKKYRVLLEQLSYTSTHSHTNAGVTRRHNHKHKTQTHTGFFVVTSTDTPSQSRKQGVTGHPPPPSRASPSPQVPHTKPPSPQTPQTDKTTARLGKPPPPLPAGILEPGGPAHYPRVGPLPGRWAASGTKGVAPRT